MKYPSNALPLLAASVALAALSIPALGQASLTESAWHIIGSQNAPTSNTSHNISVSPGFFQGYSGQSNNDNGGTTPVEESFGATILDYGFYKINTGVAGLIEAYSSGSGTYVITPTAAAHGGNQADANVWDTNDPGGYTFPNAANYTGNTVAKVATCDGSIDISTLTSGRIYFFYGSYAGWS